MTLPRRHLFKGVLAGVLAPVLTTPGRAAGRVTLSDFRYRELPG
jgi:hypothetical protein